MSRLRPLIETKTLVLLVSLGVASLLSSMLFGLFGPEHEPQSAGPDSFSRSALGHEAFVNLLRQEGVQVQVSRFDSARRAENRLLVLIEPQLSRDGIYLEDLVNQSQQVLVVLPKRSGKVSQSNPKHLEETWLIAESEGNALLAELGIDDVLLRDPAESVGVDWYSGPPTPQLDEAQLIWGANLEGIVVREDGGILLGKYTHFHKGPEEEGQSLRKTIYILSDPDVFQTHGLVKNEALALWIINELRGEGVVIIDETLHGFLKRPSLKKELVRFPLVLVLMQFLLLSVALIWAGIGRFGPPEAWRAPQRNAQLELIETSAQLLDTKVHRAQNLNRFFIQTVQELAQRLRAPALGSQQELLKWLAARGESRGSQMSALKIAEDVRLLTLELKVDAQDTTDLAQKIALWREEMLNGS